MPISHATQLNTWCLLSTTKSFSFIHSNKDPYHENVATSFSLAINLLQPSFCLDLGPVRISKRVLHAKVSKLTSSPMRQYQRLIITCLLVDCYMMAQE